MAKGGFEKGVRMHQGRTGAPLGAVMAEGRFEREERGTRINQGRSKARRVWDIPSGFCVRHYVLMGQPYQTFLIIW